MTQMLKDEGLKIQMKGKAVFDLAEKFASFYFLYFGKDEEKMMQLFEDFFER